MQSVSFTGVNSKMGSLITFRLKGTEGAIAEAEQISEVFCHLVSESILETRSDGSLISINLLALFKLFTIKILKKKLFIVINGEFK